jgi:predicted CoA-binding protein
MNLIPPKRLFVYKSVKGTSIPLSGATVKHRRGRGTQVLSWTELTMNTSELLRSVGTILVIDWPTKEVPESLARAGFHVVVRGGPGPADYSVYEVNDGVVKARSLGHPPESASLVYAYRPLSELPGIVATARSLGAKAIWTQFEAAEELAAARSLVESAGLIHVNDPDIVDAAQPRATL